MSNTASHQTVILRHKWNAEQRLHYLNDERSIVSRYKEFIQFLYAYYNQNRDTTS